MNRGWKLYAIGIIFILLAANIPEVKQLIENKAFLIAPHVRQSAQLTFDTLSNAIAPLAGKIVKMPRVVIDGQVYDVDTKDDFSLSHGQSLSAAQIDQILKDIQSPAYGTGAKWVVSGVKYDIDAAYMLAIFLQESNAGTAQGWAGFKKNGTHTYNIGNMICAGYDGNGDGTLDCYDRFRDYSWSSDPWQTAIDDNTYNLRLYRDSGIQTFDKAILKWAPPIENNTGAYIQQTYDLIRGWRIINKAALSGAQAVSAPITIDITDSFGFNVNAALESNNGALQHFSIKNGEQWSFNATLGKPDVELKTIAGQYGGGWCDLGCRYVQVFVALGLRIRHVTAGIENLPTDGQIVFIQHGGIALNQCSYNESPYIWSDFTAGFHDGNQDIIVNNTTGKTIVITVNLENNRAIIQGKLI